MCSKKKKKKDGKSKVNNKNKAIKKSEREREREREMRMKLCYILKENGDSSQREANCCTYLIFILLDQVDF